MRVTTFRLAAVALLIALGMGPACSSSKGNNLFAETQGGAAGAGPDASSGAAGEGGVAGSSEGGAGVGGGTGEGGAGGGGAGAAGEAGSGEGGSAGTGGSGQLVCDPGSIPSCFSPCTASDPQPCHCKASYGNSYCSCTGMGMWDCGNPPSVCPEPGPKCYEACSAESEGLWCGCDIGQGGVQQCGCTSVGGGALKWQCGTCPQNEPNTTAPCMSSGLTCIYGSKTCVCQNMAWTCQG